MISFKESPSKAEILLEVSYLITQRLMFLSPNMYVEEMFYFVVDPWPKFEFSVQVLPQPLV